MYSALGQAPASMSLQDLLGQRRGGGSPPFQPPGMQPPGTLPPVGGAGGVGGGSPPILPMQPRSSPSMPATGTMPPSGGSGSVGMQSQNGEWVDAGFGSGHLNDQGQQWHQLPPSQPSQPLPPTPSVGFGRNPNPIGGQPPQMMPPGQMQPRGSDVRPSTPTQTMPGQMQPQPMKGPYGDVRLQQVIGSRRPGKY